MLKSATNCTIEDFAVYFVNYIKSQTAKYTKDTSNSTPSTPTRETTLHPLTPTPISISRRINSSNLSHSESTAKEPSVIRRISTLHTPSLDSTPSTPQKIHHRASSTAPLRFTPNEFSTPQKGSLSIDRSFGPSTNHNELDTFSPSFNRTHDRSVSSRKSASTSICLSDFLHSPSSTPNKKQKSRRNDVSKNISSETDFPKLQSTPTSSNANHSPHNLKPKRRVVPISLGTSTNISFCSPAFQTENNLIGLGDDCEEPSMSRDLLRTHKALIAQDFVRHESENDKMALTRTHTQSNAVPDVTDKFTIDLSKVTSQVTLDRLIGIYAAIINLNLTTNVLSEVAYLLNLLNADFDRWKSISDTSEVIVEVAQIGILFGNAQNCVYFSMGVLRSQTHVLLMLDLTTIKVLLQNERLVKFDENTKNSLSRVYEQRVALNTKGARERQCDKTSLNVSYQQDIDTKHNFPTTREFAAFNKQRDMFYQILRTWQSSHFIPSWSFGNELGTKIRSLLNIMDHPINMSHLAKLYTSQLLLSCTFDDAEPDLQLVLPKADPNKLSKLQQRFHAPSHFSTDYMFPGQQAFFKEFLVWTEQNIVFMEQLKTILISELMDLNDSTYEVLNVSMANDLVGIADDESSKEYAVRSETIVKMRVLAKFIGLILAKPHQYEGVRCADVDNRQILLRNKITPEFNIKDILLRSIVDRKLLIVVPWLVQYISMLDYVTLRTTHYTEVLELLYEIYISTGIPIQATSLFIVKSCLGWLFEQPTVPDSYFKYRQNRKPSLFIQNLTNTGSNLQPVQILVPNMILGHFVDSDLWVSNYELDSDKQNIKCTLRKSGVMGVDCNGFSKNQFQTSDHRDPTMNVVEPLENILNSACPFLADFRVSIMPQKHLKSVSRTGRFRHITTKTTDLATAAPTAAPTPIKSSQTSLAEAFLHSQSLSVQRTVDFVIERTVSAVIKDFQIEHMLPLKTATLDAVHLIEEVHVTVATQKLIDAFAQAKERLLDKWRTHVPDMIRSRVEQSFTALLPNETLTAVRQVCVNMSVQKCTLKTNEWQSNNFKGFDLFSKDLQADAEKLVKGTLGRAIVSTNIVIQSADFSPADIFNQLQCIIYLINTQPTNVIAANVMHVLDSIRVCICTHTLPESMHRTAGFMTLQLALLTIYKRAAIVTRELLTPFIQLWTCERLTSFTTPPTIDEAADPHERAIDIAPPTGRRNKSFYIFQDILSSPGLGYLSLGGRSSFAAMELLLVELLAARLLTVDHINVQCVRLLRDEWPTDTLNKVSTMLLNIVEHPKLKSTHTKDSLLFLEMLCDLSRDLDMF